MRPYEPKPKPIVFSVRLFKVYGSRVFIIGRLYVGYVGIILNVPGLIAIDLWFLKWSKDHQPT